MTEACHKVFVYGTLKKGQPNEYFMNIMENVEYLGVVETCTKYPLIIGGEWNLPMLLDLEGKGEIVKGELYRVNENGLKQLDQFEGHPDFYVRKEIEVKEERENEVLPLVKCWAYFIKDHAEEDLIRECYSCYDSAGSHGLTYDTRENEVHPSQS